MVSDRRRARAARLSRCGSFFLGCFNGGHQSYEAGSASVEAALQRAPPAAAKALQLGSRPPRWLFPFSCAAAVKDACGQALEVAVKGSPHIGDLFAGAQLFLQVAPPPKLGPKRPQPQVSPSIGFLHMATANTSSAEPSLHER